MSGQQEKKRATALRGAAHALAAVKDMVGAGSQTSMKSAMMAMITYARPLANHLAAPLRNSP